MRYTTFTIVLGILSALLFSSLFFGAPAASAATNIDGTNHWAWNDLIGWIDFYGTNTVTVGSLGLTGYASSTAGDISLDCHTTRIGNICGTSDYQVTNDRVGNLSGWGWNDTYGWISFDCHTTLSCATSNYETIIDPTTGIFQNYAWNDTIGWISFNCADIGKCPTANYKVVTSWTAVPKVGTLDSATFDTGSSGGAQLNAVVWHGSQASGTVVEFQFAASNAPSGPWDFKGPDGTGNSYFVGLPDVAVRLDYSLFNNQRYFRYRAVLLSDRAQLVSPRVDEIVVNWSP